MCKLNYAHQSNRAKGNMEVPQGTCQTRITKLLRKDGCRDLEMPVELPSLGHFSRMPVWKRQNPYAKWPSRRQPQQTYAVAHGGTIINNPADLSHRPIFVFLNQRLRQSEMVVLRLKMQNNYILYIQYIYIYIY